MNKTLVIIGNGFDVNHGYKTSARHFQANLDPSEYKTFEEKHLSMDWSSEDTPEWLWWSPCQDHSLRKMCEHFQRQI